jgi:hypothetical protein
MMKPHIAVSATLLLAACASGNMDDPAFKDGYDAGCAQAHASPQGREAALAGQPELYRRGFSAGYTSCGGGREFER